MLDQAQRNEPEHICHQLRLQRGERLLDIGCGWPALICRAARHPTHPPSVRALRMTLSQDQHDLVQQRIA